MNIENGCEVEFVNKEIVQKVKSKMIGDSIVQKITDSFKILEDPTRVKILFALSKNDLCVCDLSALVGITASAMSHQLRVLRNSRLVKFRKEGKIVYYSISDDCIMKLINLGVKHAKE